MSCNKNNPCAGKYRNCLNVKITGACNGRCKFCIEANGYNPRHTSVDELIRITNDHPADVVMIVGGEPFLYPHLVEYCRGLVDKKIYITTNGTKFTQKVCHPLGMLSEMYKPVNKNKSYIACVNISLHHFSQKVNNKILGVDVDYRALQRGITTLRGLGISIRVNCNLQKGGIETFADAYDMVDYVSTLGVSKIKFAELYYSPELYVSSRKIFEEIRGCAFETGCEVKIPWETPFSGMLMNVSVRRACGLIEPTEPEVIDQSGRVGGTNILYADGLVTHQWLNDIPGTLDACTRKQYQAYDTSPPNL